MRRRAFACLVSALCLALFALVPSSALAQRGIELRPIGLYETGIIDDSGVEIGAFDPATARFFASNAADNSVLVLDLAEPWAPTLVQAIDLAPFGDGVNSVAVSDGVLAVAVEADPKQAPGTVAFFDTASLALLAQVQVGALPDMLTFTPDGSKVVVANEGEPVDYCTTGLDVDPVGSISIIDLSGGVAALTQASVATAGFGAFDAGAPAGVRIFGPGASVSQDLEPEYVAVSPDSSTAWVALQENNALAVVDLLTATVTQIVPLGWKDHSTFRNGLDASNRDDVVRIRPWPVRGQFQPDAIAAFETGGATYLVTANEGDARDYDCFVDEERIEDVDLDPAAFPNAAFLRQEEQLGRLKVSLANGDTDGDGRYEELYSFGARSLSIWSAAGDLIYDSGNELEVLTAGAVPGDFNSSDGGGFDNRSDDKGPEPEGVVVGQFRGRSYAFLGLERVGGVAVWDVTEPNAPFFVTYVNTTNYGGDLDAGEAGNVGPEGLVYIPLAESPIARALLVVTYEVSGTVQVFSILPQT
ncbi:MAG: choice-of-anchor I family protein [Acidobacteriota bacterium]